MECRHIQRCQRFGKIDRGNAALAKGVITNALQTVGQIELRQRFTESKRGASDFFDAARDRNSRQGFASVEQAVGQNGQRFGKRDGYQLCVLIEHPCSDRFHAIGNQNRFQFGTAAERGITDRLKSVRENDRFQKRIFIKGDLFDLLDGQTLVHGRDHKHRIRTIAHTGNTVIRTVLAQGIEQTFRGQCRLTAHSANTVFISMSRRGNDLLLLQNGITFSAMLSCGKSRFRTGRRYGGIDDLFMIAIHVAVLQRIYRWHDRMAKQINRIRAVLNTVAVHINGLIGGIYRRHNGMSQQIDRICAVQNTVAVHVALQNAVSRHADTERQRKQQRNERDPPCFFHHIPPYIDYIHKHPYLKMSFSVYHNIKNLSSKSYLLDRLIYNIDKGP